MTRPGAIFIIGDSHIGLNDGDQRRILAWLDKLEPLRPGALYLNGDAFHYFIGHPNFLTNSVHRVFERLRRLRDSGTAVHYIEANRDLVVRDSILADALTDVATEASFEVGGKRYLVTHGDMINDRDLP